MKFFNKCFVVLAGVACLSTISMSASAQETNRDEEGNIQRGPYLTNGIWDNWFVGIGAGINTYDMLHYYHNSRFSLDLEAYVGKWFTPSVGARLGYAGVRTSGWLNEETKYTTGYVDEKGMYKEQINMYYIHGDLMWNVLNAWCGYKETRFWDVIPYITTGYLHAASLDKTGNAANYRWANGLGIFNNFRITERLSANLDIRAIVFNHGYNGIEGIGNMGCIASASVGLSYKLGKTNWTRSSTLLADYCPLSDYNDLNDQAAALADENNALKAENADLKAQVKDLNDKVGDLQNQLDAANNKKITVTPGAVYFVIGQTTLSSAELSHLEFYVKNVIEQDADATFVLTGYADKDTGGKKRNQYLSQKRVDYVVNILKTQYGISEERIIVKAVGCDAVFNADKAELNRCVSLDYAE